MQKQQYCTQVRMPKSLGKELKERAKVWGVSTNRIMVSAIEAYLSNTSPSAKIKEVLQVEDQVEKESNHE